MEWWNHSSLGLSFYPFFLGGGSLQKRRDLMSCGFAATLYGCFWMPLSYKKMSGQVDEWSNLYEGMVSRECISTFHHRQKTHFTIYHSTPFISILKSSGPMLSVRNNLIITSLTSLTIIFACNNFLIYKKMLLKHLEFYIYVK